MKKRNKILFGAVSVVLVFAVIAGVLIFRKPKKAQLPPVVREKFEFGELLTETAGNTEVQELNFASEEEMLSSMQKGCENETFALYYHPDNMAVALLNKTNGKVMFSNPYNAAKDPNHSGDVGEKLDSQVVLTYLEKETTPVELYSSVECAAKGQYGIKTYENALSFEMVFGEEQSKNAVMRVFSEKTYETICETVSEDTKDLLDLYYVHYSESDLADSGIFEVYPDIKKQDLYYCNYELSERDKKKLSAAMEEAGFTVEDAKKEAEKLELGESTESSPYFKLTLNYVLTDTGVTVNIPNESVSYNGDFPLLRLSVLPYFGAEEAGEEATGYLFIPDGMGTVIKMNRESENRRTIMTGKVYGENGSALPKKTATEKTEQYYLPVFGTVRNNGTALFGIITGGDGNAEITSVLGRPRGNYYAVNPEFLFRDYEQYTRVSGVENPWSNKTLYLYDKNTAEEDFNIRYTFLSGEEANYSAMARVYREYLFGKGKEESERAVLHLETVGSALTKKSMLGFSYDAEAVFTGYEDNLSILDDLKKANAASVSLTLTGWQKNGLDAGVSDRIRPSSALGGKTGLQKIIEYCRQENITLSLLNYLSFVGSDKWFDNFKPGDDAARTLELQYAKNASLQPDTMEYDEGRYVVKASVYDRYLSGLKKSADSDYNLNLGALGYSLNADYTKKETVNRGQALRYITDTLERNSGNLSFEKGNAYVLKYAGEITHMAGGNSGLPGETAAVPFLQMVIGSNAACSSEPINLKENKRDMLLTCIESGMAPTYLLSYSNTSALKSTDHTEYYAIDYSILKESMLEDYAYVEKAVTAAKGSSIESHEILAEGVTVSTFQNGAKVYVNKTDKDYTADGITVKAKDYTVKG